MRSARTYRGCIASRCGAREARGPLQCSYVPIASCGNRPTSSNTPTPRPPPSAACSPRTELWRPRRGPWPRASTRTSDRIPGAGSTTACAGSVRSPRRTAPPACRPGSGAHSMSLTGRSPPWSTRSSTSLRIPRRSRTGRCARCSTRSGERLGDGRDYLVGDRFTTADLTFAALAAPAVAPAAVRRSAAHGRGAPRRDGRDGPRAPPAPRRGPRPRDVPRRAATCGPGALAHVGRAESRAQHAHPSDPPVTGDRYACCSTRNRPSELVTANP